MKIIEQKKSYCKLLENNNIFILNDSTEKNWNIVMNIIHGSLLENDRFQYNNISGALFYKRSINVGKKNRGGTYYYIDDEFPIPIAFKISTLEFLKNYIL